MATRNQINGALTGETGTGSYVGSTSATLVTPLLGTPTSGTLTNCTGLPISTGVSGLGSNVATWLATPSSANLAAALTDETGTGAAVFGTGPVFTDMVTVNGELDVVHTAASADDHALEVDVDAAGFGDVKAIEVEYITGAIAAGDEEAVVLVNVDESAATGGDVFGIEILATDGSANIYGTGHGVNVNPIAQFSGTFGDMDYARYTTSGGGEVDCLTDFITPGAGVTMFTADNDYVIIGDAAQFAEIEFILDTVASGAGIKPTFQYSTGGSGFTTFTPTDGTNGMRFNGVVAWVPASISAAWMTNASGNYEIKIIRTQNSLGTPPIEDLVQIASTVLYEWTKTGDVNVKSVDIDASSTYSVDGTAILSDAAGTMTLSNVDALDATTTTTIQNALTVGKVLQVVNTQTGAVATGTTVMPLDDTIPQNTEGDEYMTLAITPANTNNKLIIDVVINLSNSAATWMISALFQDSTASALCVGTSFESTNTALTTVSFRHYMTAGTVSSTTFKVRGGGQIAGTTTLNGQAGARRFGGTFISSITITEIET